MASSEAKGKKGNAKREATHKFNLSKCQLKKKKTSDLICKEGRSSVVKPSQMDIVHQAVGIHDLLEELIMEILIRLPLPSLLRSKCVSKFWNTLISDPSFKKKHLTHAKNHLNSQKFLLYPVWYMKGGEPSFYSTASLSTVQHVDDMQKHDYLFKSDLPTVCKNYGSCDGLVLLGFLCVFLEMQLFLWNPSIRELVPLPDSECFSGASYSFGLGYDATGYKIIKLDRGNTGLPTNEILDLKGGSWRKISTHPTAVDPKTGNQCVIRPAIDLCRRINPLAFLHGAFHWLGHSHVLSVVSFSIPNEVYGNLSLLETMYIAYNMDNYDCGISVLGGMLCFYSTHNIDKGCGTFKLWAMKDYGVKESWTNLFTIRETGLDAAKPTYMFADGEVLLWCKYFEHVSIFKTSKQSLGLNKFLLESSRMHEAVAYIESLISPKSLI